MKSNSNARRGFTIIDVLAVAGGLTVFLALLMPALLHARENARKNDCKRRMKSILVALHNYHNVYTVYPPGWVSRYRDADSEAGWGWMSKLLPYLDQSAVYKKLKIDQPLTEPDESLSVALECFQCPDDSTRPEKNSFRGGYGTSSYSGNAGSTGPIRWTDGRVESYWPGAAPTYHCAGAAEAQSALDYSINGVFGWNSRVAINGVTDGTSNTLAIGERSRISGWSLWAGVGSNRFENDAVTDVSFASTLNKSLTGFSSPHDGGVNVGMLDGTVRFLGNNVESKPEGGILQRLGGRADNLEIPPGTFTDF